MMSRALADKLTVTLGAIFLSACDVSVRDDSGDAAGPGGGLPDSGLAVDGGSPADAGDVCDFAGCDCTTLPCKEGLVCGPYGECVKSRACIGLAGQCADDSECCPGADALTGTWCGTDGTCVACGLAGGACQSDFECCPVPWEDPPLVCKKGGRCDVGCYGNGDCTGAQKVCHLLDRDCVDSLCSTDSECAFPLACSSGRCAPKPVIVPDSCVILSKNTIVTRGARIKLHAAAFVGDALAPRQVFSWKSSDPGRVSVDTAGVATGMDAAGPASVVASLGDLDCGDVTVTNVFPANTDHLRVFAIDADTRVPVPGAAVVVGGAAPVATDANGEVVVASGPADVHVFHPDYSYVSVLGAGLSDYVVYLRPRERGAGGFRGQFGFPPGGYGLKVGLAGCSILDVFGLGLEGFLGEPLLVHMKLETSKGAPVDFDDFVRVASGAQWYMLGEPYETSYIVPYNYAPRCDSGGLKVAWGLGNALPPTLTEVTGIAGAYYPSPLIYLFGVLEGGRHGISSRFLVQTLPLVETPLGGKDEQTPIFAEPFMPDRERFQALDLDLAMPFMLETRFKMPPQPTLRGAYLGGALAASGALVPGIGLVPLGFSADEDTEPSDGVLDRGGHDVESPAGALALRLAPPYGGLEENRYLFVLLAMDTSTSYTDFPPLPGQDAASATLVAADRVEAEYDLSGKSFLPFPEGSSISAAERKIVGAEAPGANLYRYALKTSDGNRWYIHASASASREVFIPPVPAGLAELSPESDMVVHALAFRDAIEIADVFSIRPAMHPDDWLEHVEQFSTLRCLKKISPDDPEYPNKCQPLQNKPPDAACNPACEVR